MFHLTVFFVKNEDALKRRIKAEIVQPRAPAQLGPIENVDGLPTALGFDGADARFQS
jgi:hypothetical protein